MEKDLNIKIRNYIDSKGIKLKAISIKTNIPYDRILGYFSRKKSNITTEDYFEICKFLNLDLDYFYKN